MNELALFAGAGGGLLGSHLLGWRTVCAVERDAYAAAVLAQRQNDGHLPPFPIWSDVCSFDGRAWRGIVDVVSGGFPCQDISLAGNGDGLDGERSGLWREFARIIGEVRPRFAFIENSPALTVRGLDRVLCDLASLGFDAEWGCLSAAQLGAAHERDRIWVLAYTNSRWARDNVAGGYDANRNDARWQKKDGIASGICSSRREANVPDANGNSIQGMVKESQQGEHQRSNRLHDRAGSIRSWSVWPAESGLVRVADGVADRMDRIKAIGNGQVSRVAAGAFLQLAKRGGLI